MMIRVVLLCLSLTGCAVWDKRPRPLVWMYDHLVTNTSESLAPPPDIGRVQAPERASRYDDPTRVYVEILIDYEEYVGRYIDELVETNPETLGDMVRYQGCADDKIFVDFDERKPEPPKVPTVTEIEHDVSGYLLFNFVKDLEEWVEDLEGYNDRRLKAYQHVIARFNKTCER